MILHQRGLAKSRSRPRSHVRGRSKADKRRRQPDLGDRRSSTRRKADPIVVTPPVTIPRPTVASIFQGGAEDLSSSCPTSQEPAQTVPQIFQSAGALQPMGGPAQVYSTTWDRVQVSRILQGIHDRKVSEEGEWLYKHLHHKMIQPKEANILHHLFTGRPFSLDQIVREPQLPPR